MRSTRGNSGEAVEAPPDWWWDQFNRRQVRIRRRIVRLLGIRPGSMTAHLAADLRYSFDAPEVDHAVATLAADGVIVGTPVRGDMRWRLADGPGEGE